MTAKVTTTTEELNTYPRLMISIALGNIVYFISSGNGTVIDLGDNNGGQYYVGEEGHSFSMSCFTPAPSGTKVIFEEV